jgi:Domain of unknown function (DUF4388)
MTKPTVTATDRLANVMDVVELGRRTGLLRVERDAGMAREEGEVYFAQGKPVYAAIAGLRGRDALRFLAQWGGCYFSFDAYAPQPIPNISGVLPAVSAPPNEGFVRSGPTGPYGQSGYNGYNGYNGGFGPSAPSGPRLQVPPPAYQPANQAGYQPGYQPGSSPMTPNFGASGAFSPAAGAFSSDLASSPWGASGPNGAGQPAGAANPSAAHEHYSAPVTPFPGAQTPSQPQQATPLGTPAQAAPHPFAERRPKRATDVRDLINVVTKYNLARSHRTVLLLADGEHTVQDISRLSGKPVEDVVQLLRDLEERHLVLYPA